MPTQAAGFAPRLFIFENLVYRVRLAGILVAFDGIFQFSNEEVDFNFRRRFVGLQVGHHDTAYKVPSR